jgi:hypothetical protein
MNTLHLILKRQWFEIIYSGEKKEEYRKIIDHWAIRFTGYSLVHGKKPFKHFDTVTFQHGYAKDAPRVIVECKGIEIGTGKSEWGATGESFIIKLGKIISK